MLEIKTASELVLEHLREQIISAQLKPGEYLNESLLSSKLKVSRPPIREAFQILEQEKLIISIPRKGRYVAEISEGNLREIYEVRIMIECYAIELLSKKGFRDFSKLEKALEEARAFSTPSLKNQKEKLNFIFTMEHFHTELVESAGNGLLFHFYQTLKPNLLRYRYIYLFIPGMAKKFLKQHGQILDLLKKGEYRKAKSLLLIHMNNSFQLMKERIKQN